MGYSYQKNLNCGHPNIFQVFVKDLSKKFGLKPQVLGIIFFSF